jgi:hypothetical protein
MTTSDLAPADKLLKAALGVNSMYCLDSTTMICAVPRLTPSFIIGEVTESIVIVSPASTSVSLARTSIDTFPSSSTLAVSFAAVGASFIALIVKLASRLTFQ